MILLFSESRDFSTNKVIDWLIYWKQTYIRHNGISMNDVEFDFSKLIFSIHIENEYNKGDIYKGEQNIANEIKSIWYRRPYKGVQDFYKPLSKSIAGIPIDALNKQLKSHFTILKELVIKYNSKAKILGSYQITGLNKPKALLKANKYGLNIPKTLITNSYAELRLFFECNNKKIICKPLYECMFNFPRGRNYGFAEGTNLIEDINAIPKEFAPSLFQEYIEKEYEIRIVLLNNKLYSMCIFSQSNEKTMVDFRNYDEQRPNRMIPYQLDTLTAQKIKNLMSDIGLNMGSIDLLKSKNGKLYFLEVNPVGQYDFVSYFCNYQIHKEIANFLINEK